MKPRLLVLLVVLTNPLPCVAEEALYAGKPLAFWLKELESREPLVREEAILVLTDAGPVARAAVPRLEALAKDEQRGVRLRAGLALWRIAGQKKPAIAALTEAVRDPNTPDRVRLLSTLADMGADAVASTPVLLDLVDDSDRALATQAVQLLPKLGSHVFPVLTAALEHKSPRQRRNASEVLSRMGNFAPEAAPVLRRGLDDDDKLVRANCARALWSQGQTTETVVAVLLDAARTGDAGVRRRILDTVGYGRRSERGDAILKELLKDGDLLSRVRAANALDNLDAQAKLVLPIYLQGIKDATVRNQAAQGIIRLGPAARSAVPTLIDVLKAPDGTFAYDVHSALAAIGAPAAPPVVELLTSGNTAPQLRTAATNVLARMGALAVPALLPLLNHADAKTRIAACQVLFAMGPAGKDALPKLTPLLKDDDRSVRRQAVAVLGRLGPAARPATAALIELTGDKVLNLRTDSLKALEQIQADPELVRPIAVDALEDENALVRVRAVSLLWHVDPQHSDVMPHVLDLLKQPQQPLGRPELLALIGQMGPTAARAVPALTKMLADRDAVLRGQAVQALWHIGPPARSAVPALVEMLPRANSSQRQMILNALLSIRSDDSARIVPAVLETAKKDSTFTRMQCLGVLAHYERKAAEAVPWLVEELHRPPGAATIQVADALFKIDPERARKEAPPVLRAMFKGVSPFRVQAAGAFLRLQPDSKEALAALIDCLQSPDVSTRQQAGQHLAVLGPAARSAVPALRRALRDPVVMVRIHAAAALYKIADDTEATVPVLTEPLKSAREANYVRHQAALFLGDMGPAAKEALPILRPLREETDAAVRNAVLMAIQRIDPPPPQPADKPPDR